MKHETFHMMSANLSRTDSMDSNYIGLYAGGTLLISPPYFPPPGSSRVSVSNWIQKVTGHRSSCDEKLDASLVKISI